MTICTLSAIMLLQTELTMMAVPAQNIPLPVIRQQVEDRMATALKIRSGDDVSSETLARLVQLGAAINSKPACIPLTSLSL